MGFADIHQRTPLQVQWDEWHREAMEIFPEKSAREIRRWMIRNHGKRPGGGRGLNA